MELFPYLKDKESFFVSDLTYLNGLQFLSLDPSSLIVCLFCLQRCAGAGHIREDIVYYTKELKKGCDGNDEHEAYLIDMGIKALRLD